MMWVFQVRQTGFTIVELLIVIVIIGIIAGLVISTFAGLQNKAHDSSVLSDAKNFKSKMEVYAVNQGDYPTDATALSTAGLKINKDSVSVSKPNTAIYCRENGKYAVLLLSKSGKTYISTESSGAKQLSTTWSETTATACANAGISTSGPGYGAVWLRSTSAWLSWH